MKTRNIIPLISLAMLCMACSLEEVDDMPGTFAELPKADFSFEYIIDCTALYTVSFTNDSENGETFKWTYEDGSPESTISALQHSHQYASAGDYTVRLIATNSIGVSDTIEKTVPITPISTFEERYGGASLDEGKSVIELDNGEFMLVGHTQSFGAQSFDILIYKIDSDGKESGPKLIFKSGLELVSMARRMNNSNLIALVGSTTSIGPAGLNAYVATIDFSGNLQEEAFFGDAGGDLGFGLDISSEDSLLIVGKIEDTASEKGDVLFVKTDDQLTFSPDNYPRIYDVDSTGEEDVGITVNAISGKGAIIVGTTTVGGTDHVFLLRINEDGSLKSTKVFDTFEGTGADVLDRGDDKLLILANSPDFGVPGGNNIVLLFINSSDNIQSNIPIGDELENTGSRVIPTAEGGLAIVGTTENPDNGSDDVYFILLDAGLDPKDGFPKRFGGMGDDRGADILQTSDCGFIIIGSSNTESEGGFDFYVIKTGPEGN